VIDIVGRQPLDPEQMPVRERSLGGASLHELGTIRAECWPGNNDRGIDTAGRFLASLDGILMAIPNCPGRILVQQDPSRASLEQRWYAGLPEVQMAKAVDVSIPVEPEAAVALADARNREAVGRLVGRVLRPRAGPSPLAQAIAELKADARAAGLTDTDIDAVD
jgi:hypothetical protein